MDKCDIITVLIMASYLTAMLLNIDSIILVGGGLISIILPGIALTRIIYAYENIMEFFSVSLLSNLVILFSSAYLLNAANIKLTQETIFITLMTATLLLIIIRRISKK